MLKYLNGTIVMQEVPDEVSLAIVISGCIHKCPDCHSKYSWEDKGQPLLEHLPIILQQYKKYITCLCLMGGDQDQFELLSVVKQAHDAGLKTCLYSGYDEMSQINRNLLDELDYLKLGKFDKEKGPLNSATTNQKMFKKEYSPFGDEEVWIDITDRFWPKSELL